jgi:hypothetical protein
VRRQILEKTQRREGSFGASLRRRRRALIIKKFFASFFQERRLFFSEKKKQKTFDPVDWLRSCAARRLAAISRAMELVRMMFAAAAHG